MPKILLPSSLFKHDSKLARLIYDGKTATQKAADKGEFPITKLIPSGENKTALGRLKNPEPRVKQQREGKASLGRVIAKANRQKPVGQSANSPAGGTTGQERLDAINSVKATLNQLGLGGNKTLVNKILEANRKDTSGVTGFELIKLAEEQAAKAGKKAHTGFPITRYNSTGKAATNRPFKDLALPEQGQKLPEFSAVNKQLQLNDAQVKANAIKAAEAEIARLRAANVAKGKVEANLSEAAKRKQRAIENRAYTKAYDAHIEAQHKAAIEINKAMDDGLKPAKEFAHKRLAYGVAAGSVALVAGGALANRKANEAKQEQEIARLYAGAGDNQTPDTPEARMAALVQEREIAARAIEPTPNAGGGINTTSETGAAPSRQLGPDELFMLGLPENIPFITNKTLEQLVNEKNGATAQSDTNLANQKVSVSTFDNTPEGELTRATNELATVFANQAASVNAIVEDLKANSPDYQFRLRMLAKATRDAEAGSPLAQEVLPDIERRVFDYETKFTTRAQNQVGFNGKFKADYAVAQARVNAATNAIAKVRAQSNLKAASPKIYAMVGQMYNLDANNPADQEAINFIFKSGDTATNKLISELAFTGGRALRTSQFMSAKEFKLNSNLLAHQLRGNKGLINGSLTIASAARTEADSLIREQLLNNPEFVLSLTGLNSADKANVIEARLSEDYPAAYAKAIKPKLAGYTLLNAVQNNSKLKKAFKSSRLSNGLFDFRAVVRALPKGANKEKLINFITTEAKDAIRFQTDNNPMLSRNGVTTEALDAELQSLIVALRANPIDLGATAETVGTGLVFLGERIVAPIVKGGL